MGLFFAFMQSVYSNDSLQSKIILYRENQFQGSAVSYKIFMGDSMIIKIRNNSYFEYSCLPGEYDFSLGKLKSPLLHLKVAPNKTYYLRFNINVGFWTSTPELLMIDSVSAYSKIKNGSLRMLDKKNTPLVRPKNRIGLNINLGGGFESIPFASTSNGREAKLSFGGGYAMGLKYGRELNKHWDLALDLNYQGSELTPSVSNGSVSFGRGILSITPSYIFPIDGGDAMRIKVGVGLDSYFGSNLKLKINEISGGVNDTWKYKNCVGYHLSAIWELNVSTNWSLNYGLKWYTTSYNFNSSNGTSYPIDTKLSNPNGSGIDFLCGVYYNF